MQSQTAAVDRSQVHRESRIYFTIGLLFAFDQLAKWLALNLAGDGFSLIPSFMRFELYLNPNILLAVPLPNVVVIAVTIAILVVMLLLTIRADKANKERAVWEYALIFAGGLSNLIDRFRVSASIDYVTFSTPIIPYFNLGDLMIAVGIVLLLISQLRSRASEELTEKPNQQ